MVFVIADFEYNAAQYALNNLKEENDALKCQLEAYKNEVDLVKHDVKNDSDEKDKQMKALQQALQGMQQVNIISSFQNIFKVNGRQLFNDTIGILRSHLDLVARSWSDG